MSELFKRLSDRGWIIFFFAVAFCFFGQRPLWDPDEGRYAEVARQMVVTGDWLVPQMSGHEHMTKPPFTYWMGAIGIKIFGVNAWGARFFLAWACFGTLLVVAELARTMGWNRDEAHAAALVYGTAALTFASGHILTTDMFLTFWETLGILGAWKVWSGKGNPTKWRWVFWIAFGMAFLTKGPPGWIPLAAIGVYAIMRRSEGKPTNGASLFAPLPITLFILISISWYLAIVLRDPARLDYFVKEETVNRVLTDKHERNNPFWIYPPLIFAGSIPWIFLWPQLYRRTRARMKEGWNALSEVQKFTALWFFISFVIFTLAKSRMPLYPVPMMVALALWEGKLLVAALPRIEASARWGKFARNFAFVWAGMMFALTVYPEFLPFNKTYRALGLALRDLPELKDPRTKVYWIGDDVNQSLSFYAQTTVYPLDVDHEDVPQIGREAFANGERPIYATKTTRVKKFDVEPEEMGTLIKAGPGSAIIFRP